VATVDSRVEEVRASPSDHGRVELIARRPEVDAREVLDEATLDPSQGLIGDNWSVKPSLKTGFPNPEAQLTLMNSRVIAIVSGGDDRERWAEAGDQLFVDLDISYANLPPGTRLQVGEAVIEVTEEPHRGCGKFAARFGVDAQKFVNSKIGRELNFRGINTTIVSGGVVPTGDPTLQIARRPG
jgi:hypothetical protein